jgi:DNA-binding transcriptional regulator YdaS (Cro superfamily)
MTLAEYFKDKPKGAQSMLAKQLDISVTWLSLIRVGKKVPSAKLARQIEKATLMVVKRSDLRPDLFGSIK